MLPRYGTLSIQPSYLKLARDVEGIYLEPQAYPPIRAFPTKRNTAQKPSSNIFFAGSFRTFTAMVERRGAPVLPYNYHRVAHLRGPRRYRGISSLLDTRHDNAQRALQLTGVWRFVLSHPPAAWGTPGMPRLERGTPRRISSQLITGSAESAWSTWYAVLVRIRTQRAMEVQSEP